MRSIPSSGQATPVEELLEGDQFGKLNVLSLLGRVLYEIDRGDDHQALLYFGIALIALKYKKVSFALQGVFTADRLLGEVVGERPLEAIFKGPNR